MVTHSIIPSASQASSLVQTIQWIRDPLSYMERAADRYGDIFIGTISLNMDDHAFVFVNSPQALQQIFTHDRQEFTAPGEFNQPLSILFGDTSIVRLEGDRHKKRRQLLMPSFHGERMKAYGELIIKLTHKVFNDELIMRNVSH